MGAYVLSDGTNVVSLNPEYDLKLGSQKLETSHRTRGGANYKYTWATWAKVKMTVEFVSSGDMCRINSWWGATTPLRLFDMSSTVVVSGYLANNSAPIDQVIRPYYDQFKGVIELEGY